MTSHDDKPAGGGGKDGGREVDPATLSQEELVRRGLAMDGVTIVHREDPFPVPGTRAERRAQRAVATWFIIAALAGLGALAAFLFWPWKYVPPGAMGNAHTVYLFYTPVFGGLFGLAVFALGAGAISYAKRLLPHETAVQTRHDGPSADIDRVTLSAILSDTASRSGLARRKFIARSAAASAGVFGVGAGVIGLGGLVRNPWAEGDQSPLWVTDWASPDGERVYLRYEHHAVTLVRPEDLAAGSIATVYPYKRSWTAEQAHHALHTADNPVMLIRLRPEQAIQVVKRQGQVDFNYGDFYAYSKICTHLGCPASLYESQTGLLLCPCHQSQFDMMQFAKPIFGPATRALPQLPIAVDNDGYFYATGGFIEPVGPAFWERRS